MTGTRIVRRAHPLGFGALVVVLGACASSPNDVVGIDAGVDAAPDSSFMDAELDANSADGAVDARPSDAAMPDASAAPEWASRPSLLFAGGGTNAIAVDPFDSNTVLSAGDVSGVHRSEDRGVEFENTSQGLAGEAELNGVSLAFSSVEPNLVFYLAGNKGEVDSAGLFVSHDGGRAWTLQSRQPRASASDNPRSGDLAGEPRLVGRLIALDEQTSPARRVLYVGTYGDGVLRSVDDGSTYETLALPEWPATAYVNGLWLSPAVDGARFLFVAVKHEGIWRVRLDSVSGDVVDSERLSNAPTSAEEVSGNAHVLVVAAGLDGAFLSTDWGSSFAPAPLEGAFADETLHGRWAAVGVANADSLSATTIWLGCYSLSDRRCTESLLKSVDGGATWQSGAPNDLPSPLHFAETEEVYWHADGYAQNTATTNDSLMGGRNFKAYQLTIADDDGTSVYVAANGVAWRTLDGGLTWQPIGRNVGATVAVSVGRAAGDDPSEVFGVYDWSVVAAPSSTGPALWHRPVEDTRTGRAFAYEALEGGGRWVMALSLQDNGAAGATLGGSVWTATPALLDHPPSTMTWVDEGLDVATDGRVVGVAVGRTEFGERVLLASVANGTPADRAGSDHPCNGLTTAEALGCAGLFRKVEDGEWVQVLSARDLLATTSAKAPLVWLPETTVVFFLDARRGLFLSSDAGASFVQLRDYRDGLGGVWGHLAVAPSSPLIAYVSRRGETAERITVSGDLSAPTVVADSWTLAAGALCGPLGVAADGSVFAASIATAEHDAALWRSPDGLAAFAPISDGGYSGQAIVPTDLAIAPNGDVTVACWGTGFVEVVHASGS